MQGKIVRVMTEANVRGDAPNTVTLGDYRETSGRWLEQYRGRVQLVYLDPPFYTGRQFQSRVQTEEKTVAVDSYRDKFDSMDAYVAEMEQALRQAHDLLAPSGTIFLHVDYRTSAWMRLKLDEIFGAGNFINEIIWAYESGGRARNAFPKKHDNIYFFAKSRNYFFDLTAVPCGTRGDVTDNHMRRDVDENGRRYRTIRSSGKEYRYYDDEPVYPTDVWTDISHLQQRDPERSGYETQKPLKLLKRIISSASRKGDLVADFFAGSGTTGVAAAQLGRRFLLGDQGSAALLVMDNRLSVGQTSYLIQAETETDRAVLEAEVTGGEEPAVRLDGFELPETADDRTKPGNAMPCGLAAIDHWSLGLLSGDAYVRLSAPVRARETVCAAFSGSERDKLAVMVWDYRGIRRCFRLPAGV